MNTSSSSAPDRDFCTFFDKNYLARGLALYDSLMMHCPRFTLWILCMDDECFSVLTQMSLRSVRLLKVSEVEDDAMRAVKSTRTHVEYIWMFGSQLCLYMLEKTKLDMITYLDADMYFYHSLDEIYNEFKDRSIMIIPHRFSPKNEKNEKKSGIYNVGMIIFRKNPDGLECAGWWKERCVEWCYNRYEDGKFGDQLYLNEWSTRFKNVHVLEHRGANVAPWNIENYRFKKISGRIIGTIRDKSRTSRNHQFPLIFYHFHGFKIYMTKNGAIRPYPITIYHRYIYAEYQAALQRAYDRLRTLYPGWSGGTVKKLDIVRVIKQYITIYLTRP